MKKQTQTSLAALGVFILFMALPSSVYCEENNADSSLAAETNSLLDAVKNGRAYVNFRYRYEYVDQEGLPENASASTLRSRLGFETSELAGFQALVEIEDVQEIGSDAFNSTVNGKTDFPVVPDPEGTEINQAYLTSKAITDTELKAGRHTLILDNARFIGDVGWRQNNQTQDGATLTNKSFQDTKLFYGFAFGVNRIFGEDSPIGKFDTNIHMFNIKYSGFSFGNIALYSYLLDIDESPADSSLTFGGRINGNTEIKSDANLIYDLEYAYQSDYEDNPNSYNANYYKVEGGVSIKGFTLKGGFESLGSDDGIEAFSTPLATLHKFNGWADKFLNTPDSGLRDAYAAIIFKAKDINEYIDGLKFVAAFHDFSADEGGSNYGNEWDILLEKNFGNNYGVGIKYANYNADEFATDTEKLILTLRAGFSQ